MHKRAHAKGQHTRMRAHAMLTPAREGVNTPGSPQAARAESLRVFSSSGGCVGTQSHPPGSRAAPTTYGRPSHAGDAPARLGATSMTRQIKPGSPRTGFLLGVKNPRTFRQEIYPARPPGVKIFAPFFALVGQRAPPFLPIRAPP